MPRATPIPRELVDKMNRARYFGLGMGDMRQLGLSNISLQYYLRPAPADLGAAAREYDAKYDLLPPRPDTQFAGQLPAPRGLWRGLLHLSLVDRDRRRYVHRSSRRTACATARRPSATGGWCSRRAGSKPAAELVSDFLGRPISLDAYGRSWPRTSSKRHANWNLEHAGSRGAATPHP